MGKQEEGALLRFRDKRKMEERWKELPQADAVVTDQCVLWKQTIDQFGDRDQLFSCTTAHFEVEFADARGRAVRCWTDGTPYLCSQVRRGDHMTVWYVPDDDVSRVRVVRALAEGDAGEGRSPYTKRVGGYTMFDHENLPPSKVSEEELWCEPGTFGDLAPHSGWGAEYWRCMPLMCCARWLFGSAASPERYTDADLRRFRNENGRQGRLGCLPGGLGTSFAFMCVAFLARREEIVPWVMFGLGVATLVITLVVEALFVFAARRDAGRLVPGVVGRGRVLRVGMPCFRYREEDQARGRVAEVVKVPLFSNGGRIPRDDEDGGGVRLAYCGDGYMALVDYAGPGGAERRWAFGDPRCYESYLADGQEPPVAVGDEVVVQWGSETITVWGEERELVPARLVPGTEQLFVYPTLVHSLRA